MEKETSTPICEACIAVKGTRQKTLSDKADDYQLTVATGGAYTIEVSAVGYKQLREVVTADSDVTRDYCLKPSSTSLREVVVWSSAQSVEINQIRQSPMTMTVVDDAKLRGRSSSIEEILTRTSGIRVRRAGGLGGASRTSVHGLEGKRAAVYIDGFPLSSPDGSFDINGILIDVVRCVEVYKGIVPARYGEGGLGGAISIITREDECDLMDFTQELASFGTVKTLASGQKLFTRPGILFNVVFFKNRPKDDYMMSWPVFKTNLPVSAYRKVRRRNDYYEANFYHVGIGSRKLCFDKFGLERAFYQSKKGIQSLSFDARHTYTKGINIMPNLVLEKQDFLVKGLDMKYAIVTPVIRSSMTDTTTTRRQWDGTVIQAVGETDDNLFNESHDRQLEVRGKFNLKYTRGRYTLNLNNQSVYSAYIPKDEGMKGYLGFGPSAHPSRMTANNIDLSHMFVLANHRFQNALTLSIRYLNSRIYRTSNALAKGQATDELAPKQTRVERSYYGFSEGFGYELWEDVRTKLSFPHDVRIPDTGGFFGSGVSIKPSVNLQLEVGNDLNLGFIVNKRGLCGLVRIRWETNFYYMMMKNMIRLFPADTRSIYTNLGRTRTIGMDTDVKVDVTHNVYLYFSLALQDVRNRQRWFSDEQGTSSPAYNRHVPNTPAFYYSYGMEHHAEGLMGRRELSRVYIGASHMGKFDWG